MKLTVGDALIWMGVVGTTLLAIGVAIGAAIEYHHEHKGGHQ